MEGRTVLHYRILAKIGAGGMGVVYKALDTKLNRTVALKFLPPGLGADEVSRQRFIREAMAASSLDHPNLCTIYDINETEEGQLFIAMAFYPGETLSQMLREGPVALDEALDIAIQLGRGLQKAHEQGLMHRDIKPANVIVTHGIVKVLDFGLAKLVAEANITHAGETAGTLHYMSPEQLTGKNVDARTDIWAAGVVLYEMLAGGPPFSAATGEAVKDAIFRQTAPSVTRSSTGTPAELDWILAKALAKRPEERYTQISQMVADLEGVRDRRRPVTATGPASGVSEIPTIAVLPFENLSADPENEYFSDGLTEELINLLAQIDGLHVVSRTSVYEFKKKAQDIRRVGEQLRVQYVLEGSVRKAATRIRVSAQLTDVVSGYHVWSQRYDRELSDVFAIQDEIASHIVDALKVALPIRRFPSAVALHSENIEAYQHYLKGRFYWNQKSPAGLEKAREFFERALAEDPQYALAYSGLSDYYLILAGFGLVTPDVAWSKAKAAAQKAIDLNEKLPEPHLAMASVRCFYERNWVAAERELQKALRLRPKFADTHYRYALYYMATGRLEPALEEVRKAVEFDPLSPSAAAYEGMALAYSGRHKEAIARCREALEMNPEFIELHYCLGIAEQGSGNLAGGIAAFENAARISHREPLVLGWLGNLYAGAGRREDALKILDELAELEKAGRPMPLPRAIVYTGLGDKDRAFEWLNRAADTHDFLICYLQVVPTYDSLREDPRYTQLLTRLGLLTIPDGTATLRFSAGPASS